MPPRSISTRFWLPALIACLFLSGCPTTPVTQEGASASAQMARAERLAREGKSAQAAELYERLAAGAPKIGRAHV